MKKINLLFALLAAIIIILPNSVTYADFEKEDFTQLENNLLMENVPPEKIKTLIKKLEKGELWDSMNANYNNLKPQIESNDYTKTIYPDGSFVINEIIVKNPISQISTRSIIKETSVTISKNLGVVGARFDMDYERDTITDKARILSLYNKNIWVIGGSYSNVQTGYWSDWRNPTNAWMSFDLTLGIGPIGMTNMGWIKGYANGSGHWMDWQ